VVVERDHRACPYFVHTANQTQRRKIMDTTKQLRVSAANERKNRIALLNDHFRMTGIGGKMVMTRGIANLGEEMVAKVINALREYSAWSPGDDPYGQHDFGVIKLAEPLKVFFKIDYYDARMEFGSDDPADPEKTTRVLTLMLADEY
jgi:hypothetical protein